MILRTIAKFGAAFFAACVLVPFASAQCPVNSITIKGRVDHLPSNAIVRVQLLFGLDSHAGKHGGSPPDTVQKLGESAEAILDGATFSIPVEFVTNNRRPLMSFGSRCDRKPEIVEITLKEDAASNESAHDYDKVLLEFPDDFKIDDGKIGDAKNDDYKLSDSKSDSRRYILRSEIVLDGEGR